MRQNEYLWSKGSSLYQTTKIQDWSKFRAFADEKKELPKITIFVLDRIENIAEKGENASYQHFLLFSQYFQKAYYSGSLKVGIVW